MTKASGTSKRAAARATDRRANAGRGRGRGAASRRRRGGGGGRGVALVLAVGAPAAFVAYGFWEFRAEPGRSSSVAGGVESYGWVEDASPGTPVAELLSADRPSEVTIEGRVVDMGPTMGCWLVVDDGTGELLVQTDPMVYVDQAVKGQTIRATGRVDVVNGGMGYSGERLALLTTGVTVLQEASP